MGIILAQELITVHTYRYKSWKLELQGVKPKEIR